MNTHVTLTPSQLAPASYEQQARANAKAVLDRLYGKPKVVNIAKAVIEHAQYRQKKRKRLYYLKPTKQMMRNEPRHHMDAWNAYRSAMNDFNQPRRFVKLKCFEHGVTYEEICSKVRTDRLAHARKLIMIATHEEFPNLSSPQLGNLINKDHTSVLAYLGRLKCKSQAAKEWREKKARAA